MPYIPLSFRMKSLLRQPEASGVLLKNARNFALIPVCRASGFKV